MHKKLKNDNLFLMQYKMIIIVRVNVKDHQIYLFPSKSCCKTNFCQRQRSRKWQLLYKQLKRFFCQTYSRKSSPAKSLQTKTISSCAQQRQLFTAATAPAVLQPHKALRCLLWPDRWSAIIKMHSNVEIDTSRVSSSNPLDSITRFSAVACSWTRELQKVSDHPLGKWSQNTDPERSPHRWQNRTQISASNRDSRLQIAWTYTQIQKIHQYLHQRGTQLSPTNTYYLKSAFRLGHGSQIILPLIPSQEKLQFFFFLFSCTLATAAWPPVLSQKCCVSTTVQDPYLHHSFKTSSRRQWCRIRDTQGVYTHLKSLRISVYPLKCPIIWRIIRHVSLIR